MSSSNQPSEKTALLAPTVVAEHSSKLSENEQNPRPAVLASASVGNSTPVVRDPHIHDLPLSYKWCYGVGNVAVNLSSTVVNFFINPFLLEVALVPPAYAGTILLIAKIWDGVTDPIVGALSDRTHSSWGRRKPWLVASAIPVALVNFLLYQTWPELLDTSVERFAYYLLTYCALKLAYSCFTVPYTALTTELSPNDDTRSSLTQFRTVFGIGSVLVGVIITGQIIAAFPPDRLSQANGYSISGAITSALILAAILVCSFGIKEPAQNIIVLNCNIDEEQAQDDGNNHVKAYSCSMPTIKFESQNTRAMSYASYFKSEKDKPSTQMSYEAVATVAATALTPTRKDNVNGRIDEVGKHADGSLIESIIHIFTSKAYIILCLLAAFSWIGLNAVQSNLKLYLRYSINLQGYFTPALAGSLVATMIAIPLWRLVLPKTGKRITYLIGTAWLALTYLGLYLHPSENVPFLFIACFLHGIGVGVIYLIPWTMLPDVIDQDELSTGRRREGLFYAFFVCFEKIAVGAILALSNFMLADAGFDGEAEEQPPAVGMSLRILMGLVPLGAMVVCAFLIWVYPLSTSRAKEIRHQLSQRRIGK